MATAVYAELETLLSRLCIIYEEIGDCLRDEREALINFQFSELNDINARKEAYCHEIQRIEKQREQVLDDVKIRFKIARDPVRFVDFVPSLPEPWKEKLSHLTEVLDNKMAGCMNIYELNKRFIEHSLSNINALKSNYEQDIGEATKTYSKHGTVSTNHYTVMRRKV